MEDSEQPIESKELHEKVKNSYPVKCDPPFTQVILVEGLLSVYTEEIERGSVASGSFFASRQNSMLQQ